MKYEPTEELSENQILQMIRQDNDAQFGRALRAAAMYLPVERFNNVLRVATAESYNPERYWAIAESIIVIVQARRVVPDHAEEVLRSIPDGEVTSSSRDEALALVNQMRS
jgi:hypothetical protein